MLVVGLTRGVDAIADQQLGLLAVNTGAVDESSGNQPLVFDTSNGGAATETLQSALGSLGFRVQPVPVGCDPLDVSFDPPISAPGEVPLPGTAPLDGPTFAELVAAPVDTAAGDLPSDGVVRCEVEFRVRIPAAGLAPDAYDGLLGTQTLEIPVALAPNAVLQARRKQSVRKLKTEVSCGGTFCSATVSGSARVKARGKSKKFKLKPVGLELGANEERALSLRFKSHKKTQRKVSRLLKKGRGKLGLKATAENAADSSTTGAKIKLKP